MNSPSRKFLPNSIVYFSSWKSYQIPFIPEKAISKEEAEKQVSFYIGYFDEKERLVKFEKYLHGLLEWEDIYVYWENNKLKHRHMIKSDGSETLQNFDRSGKLIK